MMLTELATPVTTNIVTNAAPSGIDTTQSSPGMAVWVITDCRPQTASPADTAVKNSRRRGLMRLVKSSASPATKHGMPQVSSKRASEPPRESWKPTASAPASTPTTMPMPPMRGTGLTWNFCGPVKSLSCAACPLARAVRTTHRVMASDVTKAASKMDMGPRF